MSKLLFSIRVDDVGRKTGDTPENGTDGNLDFFQDWLAAINSHFIGCPLPMSLGVTPTWITRAGWDRLKMIGGGSEIATHGFDHTLRRAWTIPVASMMQVSIELFEKNGMRRPRSYIPPYNDYRDDDVFAWFQAGGDVFYGFDSRQKPWRVPQGKHYISCDGGPLYIQSHATPISYGVANASMVVIAKPVVTLHVPWMNLEDCHVFADWVVDLFRMGWECVPIRELCRS